MGEKKEKKIELIQIGSRLKKIKLHFSYNRGQISKIMGISPITYTRNESGEQLPTTRSIMALHSRLGVSLEWFLFERGPMFWKPEGAKSWEIGLADRLPPELNDMIELMNKIPLLNHSIMLHFQELKIQHKDLIREALETVKNEPAPPMNLK